MRGMDGMTNKAEFVIHEEDFPALPGTGSPQIVPILNTDVVSGGEVLPGEGVKKEKGTGVQVQPGEGVAGAVSNSGVVGGGRIRPGEGVKKEKGTGVQVPPGEGAAGASSGGSDKPKGLLAAAIAAAAAADVAGEGELTQEKPNGITTHISGACANIPPSMMADQFGMAGLLTLLRQAGNPDVVSLALGTDLTTLGLNLNLNDRRNLYTTFGGPWADAPCRTQDLDAKVPEEYLTNSIIRNRLPNIKLKLLTEEVLFLLFFNCPGEVYQMAAASELYRRDWRYHMQDGVWLSRPLPGGFKEQPSTAELGTFMVFDPVKWRKVPREMSLQYHELEERPKLPTPSVHTTGGTAYAPPEMSREDGRE